MPLPSFTNLEMPILHELVATGGGDDLRFLYQRLIAYFPQISEKEVSEIKNGENQPWRKAIQKAGKSLNEKKYIHRERGFWTITPKGKELVEQETSGFTLTKIEPTETSHQDIQQMLIEIGECINFYAEKEFEFYDVIWRESRRSARISHVFEVQSKGNLDSAFAKLIRAYHNQRSKPFLIISSERDLNRARKSLSQEFQDFDSVLTILTFAQVETAHRNLKNIAEVLREFLLK